MKNRKKNYNKCNFYLDAIINLDIRGLLVSRLSDRVLQARDGQSRKNRFKNQINCNANNKELNQKST